jgi:hypothetical protein
VKVGLHAQGNGEYEGLKSATDRVINAHTSPLGESPGGLFIWVVRGSGNKV